MDLWSKGLGKRVLSLALAERDSMEIADDELVIRGVMHAPTFWDYAVTLDRRDVTEFLELLQEPESVRFVFEDRHRNDFLKAALSGAVVFAARTLRLAIAGPSASGPAGRHPRSPSDRGRDTNPDTTEDDTEDDTDDGT